MSSTAAAAGDGTDASETPSRTTTSHPRRRTSPPSAPYGQCYAAFKAAYSHLMEPRRVAIRRIAIYAAFWAVVVGALALTGNIPSSNEVRDFVDDLGALGPILYVPLFVLVNFVVAWPILAGAAGLLFGTAA